MITCCQSGLDGMFFCDATSLSSLAQLRFVANESTLNSQDNILCSLEYLDFERYAIAHVTMTFLAEGRFMVISSFLSLSLSLSRAQFIMHPRGEKHELSPGELS